MAVDLSTTAPQIGDFALARVAMHATGGNVTKVTLPAWVRRFSHYYKEGDDVTDAGGAVYTSGTDGNAQHADAYDVQSGGDYEIPIMRPGNYPTAAPILYFSCTASSGYVHFMLHK
jgi:hypothetical protein